MSRDWSERPIAILGAGLAGLSLAVGLLDARVSRPLVLVDRRRAWDQDRTWGTWLTGPLRFSEVSAHRWWSWRTRSRGREVTARTTRHPYIHLDSKAVYEAALDRIERSARIDVRAGESVVGVDWSGPRPTVRTSREAFEADRVFDAMGPSSPLLAGRPAGGIELQQRFLGWEVEVERPVFDPEAVTLMDFRGADDDGLNFMYVLPFSGTRALIEHTSIGLGGASRWQRRRLLETELSERWEASAWQVKREEHGVIPMTTFAFPVHRAPRVHAVGAAAGAIRPSSGYAYSRIQSHVDRLAAALATGTPLPESVGSGRLDLLDRIFLSALVRQRDRGEGLFWELATSVPADVFARFMTDASDHRDEARILAALPATRMLSAAALTLLGAPP